VSTAPAGRWGPLVNLVLPGGGLILSGAIASGLLVGLAFTACASFALLAVLLFPDDFSRTLQALGIGAAAGSYVGAQIRFVQTRREARVQAALARRRRALWEVRSLLESGAHGQALESVAALAREWPDDLLVAYRLAQVLTEAGAPAAAQAAWGHVRALDRHGIYREQIRAGEQRVAQRAGGAA
jgi:hypothetical protein